MITASPVLTDGSLIEIGLTPGYAYGIGGNDGMSMADRYRQALRNA